MTFVPISGIANKYSNFDWLVCPAIIPLKRKANSIILMDTFKHSKHETEKAYELEQTWPAATNQIQPLTRAAVLSWLTVGSPFCCWSAGQTEEESHTLVREGLKVAAGFLSAWLK